MGSYNTVDTTVKHRRSTTSWHHEISFVHTAVTARGRYCSSFLMCHHCCHHKLEITFRHATGSVINMQQLSSSQVHKHTHSRARARHSLYTFLARCSQVCSYAATLQLRRLLSDCHIWQLDYDTNVIRSESRNKAGFNMIIPLLRNSSTLSNFKSALKTHLFILEAAATVTICDGALESVYVLWRHRNHRRIIIIIIIIITRPP